MQTNLKKTNIKQKYPIISIKFNYTHSIFKLLLKRVNLGTFKCQNMHLFILKNI